ncbi:MAG: VOC family protein [Thaumarchaeota archaeon]|nr:VOC family protein [Nitrososphaerota archaeon]
MKAKLTYTGIRVKDLQKSVDFYTKILGMKEVGRSTIEASKGEVVNLVSEDGGHSIELNYYLPGSEFHTEYIPGESLDHLAFRVEDLDKALDEAKRAGYPTTLDMKGTTSRWAFIQDPNGIYIELFA